MVRMIPVGVVLAAMVHLMAPGALGSVFDSLKPNSLVGVNTTKQRLSDYDAVALYVFQRPLIGRGYETFLPPKYRYLDNAYLGLLIETGAIGLICYFGMIVTTGVSAFRLARRGDAMRGPPALAAAAGIAAFGVVSELFDVLGFPEVPYIFFLLAGLVVVCLRAEAPPRAVG
jgi:O-antigen ligase